MPDVWRTPHSAVLALLAWLTGLAAPQHCAGLPGAREQAALLLLATTLARLAVLRPRGRAWPRDLLLALRLGLLAFGQVAWRAQQRLDQARRTAAANRDCAVFGTAWISRFCIRRRPNTGVRPSDPICLPMG